MEKQAIDEIHEQAEKKLEDKRTSIAQKIPSKAKWFLGIATLVAIYLIVTNRFVAWKVIAVLLGGFILVYLIYSGEMNKGELTDRECRILLYQQLKWYQDNPFGDNFIIPQGKIILGMAGKKRWLDKIPWKRAYAVSILKEGHSQENWTTEVDLYTGDLITARQEYFDGREAKDIIYIRSPEVEKEKRYKESISKVGG